MDIIQIIREHLDKNPPSSQCFNIKFKNQLNDMFECNNSIIVSYTDKNNIFEKLINWFRLLLKAIARKF